MNPIEYERMFEAEETQWWYAGMRSISFALLGQALSQNGTPRVLDAGCGTGANLIQFSASTKAVGVDISDEALRYCRLRKVSAVKAELLTLPFADKTFDCVTSFDVLYHRWVKDDLVAMREIVRVTKPGGLVLVRVPALQALYGAHDKAVHTRHRYTRGEVERLFEAAGVAVLRSTYCNTLLLPVIAARRGLDRLTGREGSDVSFLPAPLEWAFRGLLEMEARFLKRASFPLGASVVCLGRKRG